MKRLGISFGYQHAPAKHEPLANRRCVNLYAEEGLPDSKAPLALYRDDGIEDWADLGSGQLSRGTFTTKAGALLAVGGTTLYSVDSLGNNAALGTVPGAGRVLMDQNLDQVVILNEAGDSYLYDTATAAFSQITDPDYSPASSMCTFGQYTVWTRAGTGVFYLSNLANAASIDALDIASAEERPDILVRAFRVEKILHLFGTATLELWYESGDEFPLDRIADGVIDVGCAAKYSIASIDSRAYWLGVEAGGFSVRRLNGNQPEIISSAAMCDELATYSRVDDAYAFAYSVGRHAFYCITFPTAGRSWRFDLRTQLWTARESIDPVTALPGRWRPFDVAAAYGRVAFADSFSGKIGFLDANTHTEHGLALPWQTVSAPVHADRRLVTFNRVEVEMNTGTASIGVTDARALLSWSDDEGRTWSNEYERSMGLTGQYSKRLVWTNLGSARSRVFRLRGASPVRTAIISAVADVEVGT